MLNTLILISQKAALKKLMLNHGQIGQRDLAKAILDVECQLIIHKKL